MHVGALKRSKICVSLLGFCKIKERQRLEESLLESRTF